VNSLLGKSRIENRIQGVASARSLLEAEDILVLYGDNKDLQYFLRQKLDN